MKLSFLLFAQVAYTANAAGAAYTLKNNKEDSSEKNSLRGGGGATTDDENAHRSLYDVMGLAPGASGCSLHSSNDGTYICGVRSNHFVTDAGRSENHLACVTHPNGSQKCAHFNLADGPGFAGAPPPGQPGSGFPGGAGVPGAMWSPSVTGPDDGYFSGPSLTGPDNGYFSGPSLTGPDNGYFSGPSLTGPDNGYFSGPSLTGPDNGYDWSPTGPSEDFGPGIGPGGYYSGASGPSRDYDPEFRPEHDGGLMPNQGGVGKCPTNIPTTGTHCCGWIPTNFIEESCYYNNGSTQCNCARQNNECNTDGWQCRGI